MTHQEGTAMDRYASGDATAFGDVYAELAPRLRGFLRKLVADNVAAEDLLQQTLLNVHRARASFEPGAAVVPWALAIARRLVIDKLRHDRRQPPVEPEHAVDDGPASSDPDVENLVDMRRRIARVATALGHLPESQRIALLLVRHEGISIAEVASALGTTEAAIKSRVHRAARELHARTELDVHG